MATISPGRSSEVPKAQWLRTHTLRRVGSNDEIWRQKVVSGADQPIEVLVPVTGLPDGGYLLFLIAGEKTVATYRFHAPRHDVSADSTRLRQCCFF